jgi:hypothetical protein
MPGALSFLVTSRGFAFDLRVFHGTSKTKNENIVNIDRYPIFGVLVGFYSNVHEGEGAAAWI